MPMKIKSYHPNWKNISLGVRTAANWQCKTCRRPCKKPLETVDKFKYRLAHISEEYYLEFCEKPGRFVLTVAHLNHDIKDNRLTNLRALCSVCHLRFDAKYHAQNAAITRAKKAKEKKDAANTKTDKPSRKTTKRGSKKNVRVQAPNTQKF